MSIPKTLPGRFSAQEYFIWDTEQAHQKDVQNATYYGRYELIRGTVYDRRGGEPTLHQRLVGALMVSLDRALTTHRDALQHEHGELCLFHGPLDVVLSEDSVVQPEILVCDSSQVTPERVVGAPRLVIEVIAPLTTLYDRREKLDLYESTGVAEYLILDPYEQFAELHLLKDGHYVRTLLGMEDPLDLMGVHILDRLGLVIPDAWTKEISFMSRWRTALAGNDSQPNSAKEIDSLMQDSSNIVGQIFKPLTLDLAHNLVRDALPGHLHHWRRLYHHALSIQDKETAEFLGGCIEDLERVHARTYTDAGK